MNLQQYLKHVKYIMIDEMSFIGRNLLQNIDKRLQQAFPKNEKVIFGGRSIILVGDLGQLPPILDEIIYACERIAKELWNSFTTVTLDTKMEKEINKYIFIHC